MPHRRSASFHADLDIAGSDDASATFRLALGDLTPPYWINMGAMAISTLAGSLLILNQADAPFLHSLLPFIKGFTVFFWATGTWWIPMLVVLALWRHVQQRFPLRYDPLYWGAVFPLGMYAVCTVRMIEAMGFHFLGFVPPVFLVVALLAWTAAFIGLLRDLWRRRGDSESRAPPPGPASACAAGRGQSSRCANRSSIRPTSAALQLHRRTGSDPGL